MANEIWLEIDDRRIDLQEAKPGYLAATCEEPCECGNDGILGDGMEREGHDGYKARGFCAGCRERRGVIHARVATLFGVEEDTAVVAGPWKVY